MTTTMLWLPPHHSPLVQGLHFQMGLIGVTHMVQELSPELHRFFHVKDARPAAGVEVSASH
jgi:hypothetical protein